MGRRKLRLGGDLRLSLERARRRADYVRLEGGPGDAFAAGFPVPKQSRGGRPGARKTLRLGGGAGRTGTGRRCRLSISRLRIHVVSPLLRHLKRLRDAYELLMLKLAQTSSSNQVMLANTGIYAMGIPGAGSRFIYS